MKKVIDRFRGEYAFLSNFHPCKVFLDTAEYSSVEHAYQAAKTNDPAEREKIRKAKTPGKAKGLGRSVTLRTDWENVMEEVMYKLVWDKFSGDKMLAADLLHTGSLFICEGNNWGDAKWGVIKNFQGQWIGENRLGKILMAVRDRLRDGG